MSLGKPSGLASTKAYYRLRLINTKLLSKSFAVRSPDGKHLDLIVPPSGARTIGLVSTIRRNHALHIARMISARRILCAHIKRKDGYYDLIYGTPEGLRAYLLDGHKWSPAYLGKRLGYKATAINRYLNGAAIHRRLIQGKYAEALRRSDFDLWVQKLAAEVELALNSRSKTKTSAPKFWTNLKGLQVKKIATAQIAGHGIAIPITLAEANGKTFREQANGIVRHFVRVL